MSQEEEIFAKIVGILMNFSPQRQKLVLDFVQEIQQPQCERCVFEKCVFLKH